MGALPLTLDALHRARQRVTPGTAGPLTASEWAENVAGHPLDEWQKTFLDDPADDQLLLCSRQVGKTLATSLRSGWIVRNGGLVIAIAPTQRQSSLVFGLLSAHLQADGADVTRATQTTIELGNGGIAHCLPGDRPSSIRGLTLRHDGPSALVIDEAAYIRETLWPSLSPMLAAAPDAGQIMLTTPCGPAGRFHAAWTDPDADEWSPGEGHGIRVPAHLGEVPPLGAGAARR